MAANTTLCVVVDEDTVRCDGMVFTRAELLKASNAIFWVYLCVYIILVLFAGRFRMVCSIESASS